MRTSQALKRVETWRNDQHSLVEPRALIFSNSCRPVGHQFRLVVIVLVASKR